MVVIERRINEPERVLDILKIIAKGLEKDDPRFMNNIQQVKQVAADILLQHSKHKYQLKNEEFNAVVSILEFKQNQLFGSDWNKFQR